MNKSLTPWRIAGLLACLWLCLTSSLSAQNQTAIPLDPQLRIGILPNGMKYYLRQNSRPEKRVELRLAVNAGSLLEDEDQLGLAHFVEHMCFNGTKNFAKNEIVSYLQSVGVAFGADLNAYTSFDETVYILPIPTDKPEIVQQGLQILEDWAHLVSFEGEEIDKERGVIVEEWRSRLGGEERMMRQYLPVLYYGSRYPERLPIGDVELIKNFKHEAIRRYYNDWYRPDLMAIMAVGDIDLDQMEAQIKAQFGAIPTKQNPRERTVFEVPGHAETLVKVAKDKEANFTTVRLYYKHPLKPTQTLDDLRNDLAVELVSQMLNARLSEWMQKEGTPLVSASAGDGSLGRESSVFQLFSATNESKVREALKILLEEAKRARIHGFTEGELVRAQKVVLQRYEKAYKDRNTTESARLVNQYIQHFLTQQPIPGAEFMYAFVQEQLPNLELSMLNSLAQSLISKENRVIIVTAPEKEELEIPTEEDIQKIIKQVDINRVEPYQDKVLADKLMTALPKPGSIKKTKNLSELPGVQHWVLSNGVEVIVKPTKFKDDEILVYAYTPGGYSVLTEEQQRHAFFATSIVAEGGIAEFDNTDLQKMLSGKNARVTPFITTTNQGINVSTNPTDLETALQLLHLYITNPRYSEQAFNTWRDKTVGIVQNLGANTQFYFLVELNKLFYQDHPRAPIVLPSVEILNSLQAQTAFEVYKNRLCDASKMTVVVAGNVDETQLRELSVQYLASLPVSNRKEAPKDLGLRFTTQPLSQTLQKGSDPKSYVGIAYGGSMPYSTQNILKLSALGSLLTNKLIEQLREEIGGVYGTGANASLTASPNPSYTVVVSFPCAPENVNTLREAVFAEIAKIQQGQISEEDMTKVTETLKRDWETNQQRNQFWVNALSDMFQHKLPLSDLKAYPSYIDELKKEDLQALAKQVFQDNRIELVVNPE
jgi:zinc protease